MSGAEGNNGFGGAFGGGAPGLDNSNEAKGFDPGLANDMMSGAYAQPGAVSDDLNNEDKTGAPTNTPDGRSLMEQAAGWAAGKVQGKIDSITSNPLGALVNAALGMVPMVGAVNSLSGCLGGPTLGAAVPGIIDAISEGRVDDQVPDVLAGFTGESTDGQNWDAGQIRYYRLRDGSITTRVIKNTDSAASSATESGVSSGINAGAG